MLQWLYSARHYFERHGYYVCSRLADRLGMRAKSVRLFFIYLSFAMTIVAWAPVAKFHSLEESNIPSSL